MRYHLLRVGTHTIRLVEEDRGSEGVVIIAHGVNSDLNHPLLKALSEGLASHGISSVRFNFPYREKGRTLPDDEMVLLESYRVVRTWVILKKQPLWLVAGGKSMGAMVVSLAEAQDIFADALFFLGYPLHSPRQINGPLRYRHLQGYPYPIRFVQGERDRLCHIKRLKELLPLFPQATLQVIPKVDHHFSPSRRQNISQEEAYHEVVQKVLDFLLHLPICGMSSHATESSHPQKV